MPTRCLLLAAVLAAAPAAAVPSDNWPAFRGPTADGHATSSAPVHWSESENVRWKTAIHGKGWSSSVVWRKQIWLTTAPEDGKDLFAVCVDRDTGRIVHDVKVFDNPQPAFCIAFNSYASPTPVVEEGRVYVHFGSAGTACLDTATGKKLWERRDLKCDHWRGPGSSPIVYGNLLVLIFDGHDVQYVAALDKATGKTVWKTDRNFTYSSDDGDVMKGYATPAVIDAGGGPQIVCSSAQATAAYDPATGREVWRVNHGGMNSACRPLFSHGLIYVTTAAGGKQLVAIRPGGHGDVTGSHVAWNFIKGVPTRASPLIVDDLMYFIHDSNGTATCIEAETGKEVKKLRVGGTYTASPIYADRHVYFCDQDGTTLVIKPGRDFSVVATNKLDAGCMASPAAVGGALFLRTKTHLYRIEGP